MMLNSEQTTLLDGETCYTYDEIARRPYSFVKRLMDIVCAGLGLLVLALPLLIVMAAIYLDDAGPVFFGQYRVGLDGKYFRMFKFRSMWIDAPHELSTAELQDPQAMITRVGKFIRKYSIDELPQLYNVLIGDMSIVGPRPLILKEQDMHEVRNQYGVYSVRPGLTGMAQIHGRDLITTDQKVFWDVKYLREYGFLTDVKIVLGTIPKILSHADVMDGARNRTDNEEE